MQESSVLSVSPLSPPSFNSYSSEKLSDIAARVVEELRKESESDLDSDIFNWPPKPTQPQPQQQQQQDKAKDNNSDKEKLEYEEEEEEEEEEEADDDFEFAFVCRESDTTTISADEIFSNGQIRPTYPIFDQSLLLSLYDSHIEKTNTTTTTTTTTTRTTTISTTKAPPSSFRRPPLRKLMVEEQERDRDTSCSSSEADELEGVPDGTYCVWTPHSSSSSSCKKSHSTGSSKRWRFRDLLYRSNSDGKDTVVFLSPSKKAEKIPVRNNSISSSSSNKNKTTVANKVAEENKRKSFLPYRKDLVGFFTNVNGLSRSLQPF